MEVCLHPELWFWYEYIEKKLEFKIGYENDRVWNELAWLSYIQFKHQR